VVGLVASRIKDQCHRPVIAFARAQEPGQLKGSGRTIPGLHLRDALAAVDARHPGLITRFGGHAMAAGLSLPETALPAFSAAFEAICQAWLSPADREQRLEHDGALAADELSLDAAHELEAAGPWGQGFPEPLFWGRFVVLDCRLLGAEQQHARYRLRGDAGIVLSAIHFNAGNAARSGETIEAVYRCGINRYQGRENLELQIVEIAERAQ
jgi:single-stranded-DNA-specific exonuclease